MLALQEYVFVTVRGWMGFATSESGIAVVTRPFPDADEARGELAKLAPGISLVDNHNPDVAWGFERKLALYFAGERVEFDDPVDLSRVSMFGRAVLEAVRSIPYGEVQTYGGIARMIRRPKAVRPVGQVIARNPVPLIIPCHRVIGSDGALRGFGWGLEAKRWLLELEGVKL